MFDTVHLVLFWTLYDKGIGGDMNFHTIEIPIEQIREFRDRYQVIEFALFGSILRDDFRPDSDVDVMVQFHPEA